MQPRSAVGRRVRENRLLLDLTQEELARRIGCAGITVRKIEAGDLRPSKQIAELLAKALGIPFEDQAEFVRQARAVKPDGEERSPARTPQVKRDEIGLEDLSGRAIRGYILGERLGQGGFGVVYRAVQPLVEREVALKIVLPEYADQPEFIRRFESEAQIVARLEHPHIVPLYDYWREPSMAYLVMRLLRGGSLEDRLRDGALPLDIVAALIDQVATALHRAHRVGVVHRDLKPANILLDEEGNAYLTDFGIAKSQSNWETQTQVGTVLGSYAYVSPEQLRGETTLPQADIYSLGVLIYELLTGRQPFDGATPIDLAQQHLNTPVPSIAEHRTDLPPALDAVIARATAKDPHQRYTDVSDLAADLRQVATTGRLAEGRIDRALEIVNPYKGLRAFGEADVADFQGREMLVQQLLGRMAEESDLERFLAIIGPSGSGKSSLAKAGLIPALRRGALPGSENWFVVDLTPGLRPFEELAEALQRVAVHPPDDPLLELRRDPFGLVRLLRGMLPDEADTEVLIVIDQFEEVFTRVASEHDRTRFLELLVATVLDERSRARIVITLRADFVDQPLRYTDFGELLKHRSELVLPLTPDELEHAIRNPAERVGLTVEPELVAAVISDVTDQPGALPLMQYALTETFEHRPDGKLTLETYRELGGVRGALARRADDVYAGLSEEDQAAARQMFLRLVTLGEGAEDTRRRVPRSELLAISDDLDAVIDHFAAYRLLTLDHDLATREPTIEVAHEALLNEWPRLSKWIDESRADIRLQRQLDRAAHDWLEADRDESFLLRGARLEQFETRVGGTELALTDTEHEYLDASLVRREEETALEAERLERESRLERTRQTLRRALVGVLGIGLLAALGLSAFALDQRDDALRGADARATAQSVAESESRARATAQADAEREAAARADAQAEAEAQRQEALIQASIGLASQAELELQGSFPERGVLLALEALENYPYTWQAERALGIAVMANHIRRSFAHNSAIHDAFWSPDGTLIATASSDRAAKLWSTDTGELVRTLEHDDVVNDVLWSPSGEKVLSRSADGQVRLWDVNSGNLVFSFEGNEIGNVDWSPSGDRILANNHHGMIKVWDAATGDELLTLPTGDICAAVGCGLVSAFSPEGVRILTHDEDGIITVWHSWTGAPQLQINAHAGEITTLSWSPDGSKILSAGADGSVGLWNSDTGERVAPVAGHTAYVDSATWSPLGDRVLTTSDDNLAKIWSATTGEELTSFEEDPQFILAGAWSPDGTLVATADLGGTIMVWDSHSGELEETFVGHQAPVYVLGWSESGDQLLSGGDDGLVRIWDIPDQTVLFEIPGEGGVWEPAWSPDGSRIARAYYDGSVRVYDAFTQEEQLRLDAHEVGFAGNVEWSPEGGRLYSVDPWEGTVKVWDAVDGTLLSTFIHPAGYPSYSSWSPDGTRIVTPSQVDGSVVIWDVDSGEPILTLLKHDSLGIAARWAPDGDRIAAVGEGAMVLNAETGEILVDLFPDDYSFITWYLAWAPDSRRLATHSDDGLRIWDALSGDLLVHTSGHSGPVFSMDWFPNADRIISTDTKGFVKVWDGATGAELLSFKPPFPGRVSLSPDGSAAAHAQDANGPVTAYRLWQSADELINYARDCCVFRELTPEEREQFGLPPLEAG